MPITAQCGACQKKFKAPDNAAGKKAKCPQCGGVIQIPAAEPPKPAASGASSPAEQAQAPAAPAAPAADASGCPACGAALAAKAVLCVDCGFDLRTGKKFETGPPAEAEADLGEPAALRKKKKKKKRKRAPGGETRQSMKFIRGCAASFGSALIGSAMWFAAAYYFHLQMPIIAWVLGGLAGVGMMLGYGVEDVLAGLAAAGMALLAILVTKVVILAIVFKDLAAVFGTGELIKWAFEVGIKSMVWPWLNILYLLLACGTAYQVGSGGSWIEE